MKKRIARSIAGMTALLLFCLAGCSQSPESMGDNYMAMSEKAQNPKAREEREKKAYLMYLQSADNYKRTSQPLPNSVKEKILRLTLRKLNREIERYQANAEEANVEQISLWREDFTKYMPGLNSKEINEGYSTFLLKFADMVAYDLKTAMETLDETIKIGVMAAEAREKARAFKGKYATSLTTEVQQMLEDAAAAMKKKDPAGKEPLVFAEYKTLLALKYDPENKTAQEQLKKLRGLLVDTYSGYERFSENLDPEIDKYDIYLCVPKFKLNKGGAALEVSFWNLTASPINVKAESFFLVTDAGDTLKADPASKFNKILIDCKTDTSQTLIFKIPSGIKSPVKNLLYSDGIKVSEKFFH